MIQGVQTHTMTSRIPLFLYAVCLVAVVAMPAVASPPEEEGTPAPQTKASQGKSETMTIRVVYDPETGVIRSVPIDRERVLSVPLTKALTRSSEGLRVFELPNGGKGVHLDGRYQHVLMVRAKPDGSYETVCTNHEHVAEKFMRGDPEVVAAEPRDK